MNDRETFEDYMNARHPNWPSWDWRVRHDRRAVWERQFARHANGCFNDQAGASLCQFCGGDLLVTYYQWNVAGPWEVQYVRGLWRWRPSHWNTGFQDAWDWLCFRVERRVVGATMRVEK